MVITQITKKYSIKPNTVAVWIEESCKESKITLEDYRNITSASWSSLQRIQGGRESARKEQTVTGMMITRLISTSPCYTKKVIRDFIFTK